MLINIIKSYQFESNRTLVEFSSLYGVAKGFWKGNIPEINQSYYVELDIPKVLIMGTDIIETECREYKVWTDQENIFLNVKLECHEDDGCLTVRLGESIILIETVGSSYPKDSFLRIQLNEISVYPYNL